MYQASGPVRTSILAVRDGNRYVLLFGDQSGWFYALDAIGGKLLWKKQVEEHDAARLTGAPVAYRRDSFCSGGRLGREPGIGSGI